MEWGADEKLHHGFIAEIGIDPDAGRGVITFYEIPAGSSMMVPEGRHDPSGTLRSTWLDGFSLQEKAWRVAA